MATNNSNTTSNKGSGIKFELGKIVHVWETKGCKELKNGPASSERLDSDYPNIEPTENLKVVELFGTTGALVERENGMRIRMHKNHIDASAGYNGQRGKTGSQKPVAQQIEEAKAAQAKAAADLENLVKLQASQEAKEMIEELTPDELTLISERRRARAEAEGLFADVEENDEESRATA